jgi:hypothetical protein
VTASPRRQSCALCPAPPASPFGLCARCLSEAADEHAHLVPRAADPGGSPALVNVRDLCPRCGSWRHPVAACPTWADVAPETGRAA